MSGVQHVEMTARDLRLLADAMGLADEVTVSVLDRVASEYWHLVARTPVVTAEHVTEDGEVVSADGTSIGARCDMCGGMACYRADCDEQRRAEQAYATERRLTADLVHIRRDLRTMVARDDDGNGWNADNVSYLLDLEALTTELLRRAQVSS